jgi:PAS domain S-box-containing protein
MTNSPSYKTLEQSIKELQREAAELRRSDEAIWEGEEKYRTLFDESRDAIYISSREGKFLDVNRALLELFEYTKEEMIDTLNVEKIYVYPGDRDMFQQEIETKGSVRDYEVKFCKKNGTEMDCLLTGSVRRSGTGRILGYQGIIRDVTEQKRVERLRDDVQRMMRHDLKSPLIGIIGLSGLLLKSKNLTDKEDSAARMIQELGERMLGFIDRTRDLFQMEQGNYTLKPQEVNILSVLHRIKKTLKPLALKRNTDFVFTIHGKHTHLKGEYMILCEEALVEIMFANLIKNAIEASPEGGTIRISIDTVERLGQGFHSIDIHNIGVVPREICKNFFKPYTTSGKDGGTGLGTHNALLVARTHKGDIRFTTWEDEGTHVTVHLPKNVAYEQHAIQPSA